jgi:TatD DNase family protein
MELGVQEPHLNRRRPIWIDSHAHCAHAGDASLAAMLSEARESCVGRIINVGTSLSSSNTVCAQCEAHPQLSAATGISPFDVLSGPPDWFERLAECSRHPSVAAIGETGMDATNPAYPPLNVQRTFFERHLALAQSRSLPVIIHSRGCERTALDICIAAGISRAVFHCYTGTRETLRRIIDRGYIISFSGIITFKNSPLNDLVSFSPLSSMLIETDSPYLAPVPHRGRQNRPAWVAYVGKAVASIKNIDEEECAHRLSGTFAATFGLSAEIPETA